jgi:hypothetical protein
MNSMMCSRPTIGLIVVSPSESFGVCARGPTGWVNQAPAAPAQMQKQQAAKRSLAINDR